MSTNMKQTYNARPLLYCGLLLTFAVELWILRSQTAASRGLHQTLLLLIFPRLTYGLTTVIILLYHTFNYKDYATMTYEILLDLQELLKGLPPSLAKPRIEKICEHSVAPLSKIKRCSIESYERMLSKKILWRAQRACPSNPLTWLFPSRTSSRVCGEESCPDKSIDNQAQVHDGFQDPDSMPPIDVVSPLTPCHSYNLRPQR